MGITLLMQAGCHDSLWSGHGTVYFCSKVAVRWVFFLVSDINSESWIFCVDPKYHTEALVVSFGRKESTFQPPWRLVVLPGQLHAVILSTFTSQAR